MMMTRLRLIRVEQVQRHSGSPAAAANLLMAAHDEDVVDKVIMQNHDETYQRSWKSVYVIVIVILLIMADVL